MTIDAEFLIEIDEYPGYFVGTDLNIYSEKSGSIKIKTQCFNTDGYCLVGLSKDGKEYKKLVHRLISEMFIPNPDNLEQVDHINRNKIDNRLENLRWVSHRDNGRNQSIAKNNTSGYQGVSYEKSQNRWVAHWHNDEGKLKVKYFSINKYGDTQAKKLAAEYRQKIVDDLYNRPKIVT